MNTQQQAYINGFVKRASEYGFSEAEARKLLKEATRWRDEMLAGNILVHPSQTTAYHGGTLEGRAIGVNTKFAPVKGYDGSLNQLHNDAENAGKIDIRKGLNLSKQEIAARRAQEKYKGALRGVRGALKHTEPSRSQKTLERLVEDNSRRYELRMIRERFAARKAEEAAQQAAYGAAKGMKEAIHPPSGLINKLKSLLRRK
jgi:hypothetical protein